MSKLLTQVGFGFSIANQVASLHCKVSVERRETAIKVPDVFLAIIFSSWTLPQEMAFTLLIWFSLAFSVSQEFMTIRKIIYRTKAHKMCHLDNSH